MDPFVQLLQGPPLLLCTAPRQTGATKLSCQALSDESSILLQTAKRHPCRKILQIEAIQCLDSTFVYICSICKYCIHIVQPISNAFPQSMVFNPNKADECKWHKKRQKTKMLRSSAGEWRKGLQYAADDVDDSFKFLVIVDEGISVAGDDTHSKSITILVRGGVCPIMGMM